MEFFLYVLGIFFFHYVLDISCRGHNSAIEFERFFSLILRIHAINDIDRETRIFEIEM